MDFYKVPIGFGMALAMNEPAMAAYSAMSEEEKQKIAKAAQKNAKDNFTKQIMCDKTIAVYRELAAEKLN